MADADTTPTPAPVPENSDLLQMLKDLLDDDEMKASNVLEKAKTEGVKNVETATVLTAEDWQSYGLPKVQARQLVEKLKSRISNVAVKTPSPQQFGMTLLPPVPSDDDFLKSLQVGGVAKMQKEDLVAAVRALLADRYGIYDVDTRILEAIDERSRQLDEPYPEIYFELDRARQRKKHAEVLRALNIRGDFVSPKRKSEFITKMSSLWNILKDFQDQLTAYEQNWQSTVNNPAALMQGIAALMGGGVPGMVAPMAQVPDPAPIVDVASGVIDQLNKLFAGPGIPVARALAADAVEYRQLLDNTGLPAAVGATTREEMLRKLDIGVTADVVRTERSAVQYVLAILEIGNIEADKLPYYIIVLKQAGATIPWDKLASGSTVRSGKRNTPTELAPTRSF